MNFEKNGSFDEISIFEESLCSGNSFLYLMKKKKKKKKKKNFGKKKKKKKKLFEKKKKILSIQKFECFYQNVNI